MPSQLNPFVLDLYFGSAGGELAVAYFDELMAGKLRLQYELS